MRLPGWRWREWRRAWRDARPGNPNGKHGEEQEVGRANEVNGEKPESADGEANGVDGFGTVFANKEEEQEGKDKGNSVIGGETDPSPTRLRLDIQGCLVGLQKHGWRRRG